MFRFLKPILSLANAWKIILTWLEQINFASILKQKAFKSQYFNIRFELFVLQLLLSGYHDGKRMDGGLRKILKF